MDRESLADSAAAKKKDPSDTASGSASGADDAMADAEPMIIDRDDSFSEQPTSMEAPLPQFPDPVLHTTTAPQSYSPHVLLPQQNAAPGAQTQPQAALPVVMLPGAQAVAAAAAAAATTSPSPAPVVTERTGVESETEDQREVSMAPADAPPAGTASTPRPVPSPADYLYEMARESNTSFQPSTPVAANAMTMPPSVVIAEGLPPTAEGAIRTQVLPPSATKRLRTSHPLQVAIPSDRSLPGFAGPFGDSEMTDLSLPPDSVPRMVAELHSLLEYVGSKPTLQDGSASFMRDYLRTLVAYSGAPQATDTFNSARPSVDLFGNIPTELTKRILSFLEGEDLAYARLVCRKWCEYASEEHLWKRLVTRQWKSLDTDPAVWKLIDETVEPYAEGCWRKIYPSVAKSAQWKCRLQKTGRFICNLVAHQVSGTPLGETGLPFTLVVERRFNIAHLQTFVLPEASILYFEPESEKDRPGFEDFIEYLINRTRAGLALESERRYIFIPPCDFSRNLSYHGPSLLGVVQEAHVPLLP